MTMKHSFLRGLMLVAGGLCLSLLAAGTHGAGNRRRRFRKACASMLWWCENGYQIDVATPAGRIVWKRIIDQCESPRLDGTNVKPCCLRCH